MGKVGTGFSMSLDGFIAGPGDDVQQVFKWFFSGDTEVKYPGGRVVVKVSPASAELLWEQIEMTGALVTGRRQFDLTYGWGGRHPLDVPVFVVTHPVPQEWVKEGSPFTFVTDGVESAVEQAKAVAGDKNVVVDGANIAQQCIKAGLVDEIGIDLVPALLGDGVRFFDHLDAEPIELESTRVIDAPGVTHLRYRIVK
ncbi:MAG: dihydrofolate reductase family protein [Gammaproteobacteria bacterium]